MIHGVQRLVALCLCAVAVVAGPSRTSAASPPTAAAPTIATHEAYVDAVRFQGPMLDGSALLQAVLKAAGPDATVYTSENYYYFSFLLNGVRYAGNLRLSAFDRDTGVIHFSYFKEGTPWIGASPVIAADLKAEDGVMVRRMDDLTYRVSFAGSETVFHLNGSRDVPPPTTLMTRNEVYVGPVFDDSGVEFFLLFNTVTRQFSFVLNERRPADEYMVVDTEGDIVIGRRTGFAFFRDGRLNRKILIGVYAPNAEANTYFDGPFDQLPDNYIQGDDLRRLIILMDPTLEGEIDRFGVFKDRERRFLIAPYLFYRQAEDLAIFSACARQLGPANPRYDDCFVVDDDTRTTKPLPLALSREH